MKNVDDIADLLFAANSAEAEMPEIRVMTLSHYAFEHHYPSPEVVVHPQIFMDGEQLSIALDVDQLDEFTHEHVLLNLLNLKEDVNLTKLEKACHFGEPVVMRWHNQQQTYVRGSQYVAQQETP